MEQLYIINRYYAEDAEQETIANDETQNVRALTKLIEQAKLRQNAELQKRKSVETEVQEKGDAFSKGKRETTIGEKKMQMKNSELFSGHVDDDVSALLPIRETEKTVKRKNKKSKRDKQNLAEAENDATLSRHIEQAKLRQNDQVQKQIPIEMKAKLRDNSSDVNGRLDVTISSNECDSEPKTKKLKKQKSKASLCEMTSPEIVMNNVEGQKTLDHEMKEDNGVLKEPMDTPGFLEESLGDTTLPIEQLNSAESASVPTGTSKEVGGFIILGGTQEKKTTKVKRVLPDWLANPTIVSANFQDGGCGVDEINDLDPGLIAQLKKSGITSFFPVQHKVIPWLLKENNLALCKRPQDICVSAPTGSGKTLAFALPIIQILKSRVVTSVRALVVLPVHDLAIQIFDVFRTYCKGTTLKAILLSGHKPFSEEQDSLVRESVRGHLSLVDIVIATPGRLVDHIHRTPGFSLKDLRFLVIDEADRMMDEVGHMWFQEVQKAVFGNNSVRTCQCSCASLKCRYPDHSLIPCEVGRIAVPFQKLLFSATLSQDPEKLGQLLLYRPKLFTSIVRHSKDRNVNEESSMQNTNNVRIQTKGEFVGKYTTPEELHEYYVLCPIELKPLVMWYFIKALKFRRVLCFTGSIENTHRLYHVLKHIKSVHVAEFSSNLKTKERQNLLQKFITGDVDVLICSDIMTRGMDIENVDYVISYDPAPFIKTYIHRIGRTARAGREGTAITLLHKLQVKAFRKMIAKAGKKRVQKFPVKPTDLKPYEDKYRKALGKLSKVVQDETKMKYVKKSLGPIKRTPNV